MMNTSLPLDERLDAFYRRTQWLRAVREQGAKKSGENAIEFWPDLGFILPMDGPGDGDFPDTIYVESGAGFPEPPDDEIARDVSIWVQQHLS